jgi:glycosyltransferase involved in cell wall biosynthesis
MNRADTNSRPLVSVIVAVRDGERFLAQALRSILEGCYRPVEILVVDGNSSDRTLEIASSFEHVRCLPQIGEGIAAAYNTGVEAAIGDYIAFLSHDDLWSPDKLQIQIEFMEQNPQVEYTIARAQFFLEPGHAIPRGFRPELLIGDHIAPIMETLVARRRLFGILGMFDTNLTIANDVDWFSRANDRKVPTAVLPQVLLSKRVHDTNLSMNIDTNNHDLLKLLKASIDRKRQSA